MSNTWHLKRSFKDGKPKKLILEISTNNPLPDSFYPKLMKLLDESIERNESNDTFGFARLEAGKNYNQYQQRPLIPDEAFQWAEDERLGNLKDAPIQYCPECTGDSLLFSMNAPQGIAWCQYCNKPTEYKHANKQEYVTKIFSLSKTRGNKNE